VDSSPSHLRLQRIENAIQKPIRRRRAMTPEAERAGTGAGVRVGVIVGVRVGGIGLGVRVGVEVGEVVILQLNVPFIV